MVGNLCFAREWNVAGAVREGSGEEGSRTVHPLGVTGVILPRPMISAFCATKRNHSSKPLRPDWELVSNSVTGRWPEVFPTRSFIQPDVRDGRRGMGEYLRTLYASLGINAFFVIIRDLCPRLARVQKCDIAASRVARWLRGSLHERKFIGAVTGHNACIS